MHTISKERTREDRPYVDQDLQTAANLEQSARAAPRSQSGKDKYGVNGARESNGAERVRDLLGVERPAAFRFGSVLKVSLQPALACALRTTRAPRLMSVK